VTENNNPDFNRRKFLKTLGGSAGAISVSSRSVVASERPTANTLQQNEIMSALLARAGNPKIEWTNKTQKELGKSNKMEVTEAMTTIGKLRYAVVDNEIAGDKVASQFKFGNISKVRLQLPKEFKSVPIDTNLMLTWDEGGVNARRMATRAEIKVLKNLIGVQDLGSGHKSDSIESHKREDNVEAAYSEHLGGFTVDVYRGDSLKTYKLKLSSGESIPIGKTAISSLKSQEMLIMESIGGKSAVKDCNAAIICGKCIAAGARCGACSPTCVGSFGLTCGICIAGCAAGVHSCTCCLHCIDGIEPPEEGPVESTC
jgi:hypothetical protein